MDYMLRFEELGPERTFASAELQDRANSNPWTKARQQYRVWCGEVEAAYLSFDIHWPDEINLYELWVVGELRGRGIGASCVRFAIELTKQFGKPRLSVRPGPLDGRSKAENRKWYRKQGFKPMKGEPDLLEIVV